MQFQSVLGMTFGAGLLFTLDMRERDLHHHRGFVLPEANTGLVEN
jgi:hypothetical protein